MLKFLSIAAEHVHGTLKAAMGLLLASAASGVVTVAVAQVSASAPGIYSCTDANGKRLTSDRPIAECLDREQRLLNRDGSLRTVLPARMSAQERAQQEAHKREWAQAEAAKKDAIRRDRNLLMRYPNASAHSKARQAAMDDLLAGIRQSERRVQELRNERKPLDAEAEFYQGKRLPNMLRSQIEANDAQQQAQLDIIHQQRAEMARLNAIYDAELSRLQQMWSGSAPGALATPATPGIPAVNRPASSSTVR